MELLNYCYDFCSRLYLLTETYSRKLISMLFKIKNEILRLIFILKLANKKLSSKSNIFFIFSISKN